MNLKVEDLEREVHSRNRQAQGTAAHETSEDVGDSLNSSSRSRISINPQSFVLASMKEALMVASSAK